MENLIEQYEDDPHAIHYAIGDIHGCLTQMETALLWCAEDAEERGMRGIVHLLGDYVDRGPNSKGVIERLLEGPKEAHMTWRPLRGNHDDILARSWYNPADPETAGWWEHGGQQTLVSYGWDPMVHGIPSLVSDWIPRRHAEFLASLPLLAQTPFAVFVHAGLRPEVELQEQSPRDLMWIRGDFLKSGHDFGIPIVHGHSPNRANPAVYENRVSLDSGCFMSGVLSVAAFDPGERRPRLERFGMDTRIPKPDEGFIHQKC